MEIRNSAMCRVVDSIFPKHVTSFLVIGCEEPLLSLFCLRRRVGRRVGYVRGWTRRYFRLGGLDFLGSRNLKTEHVRSVFVHDVNVHVLVGDSRFECSKRNAGATGFPVDGVEHVANLYRALVIALHIWPHNRLSSWRGVQNRRLNALCCNGRAVVYGLLGLGDNLHGLWKLFRVGRVVVCKESRGSRLCQT